MDTRKLQVFVSSTYLDMQPERQAAVAAILESGHIPAGMELFTAGDASQLETILRWIDESDVLLLLLGDRYGSLEPKSGKSYVQLEYEHAQSRGKKVFALVLSDESLAKKHQDLGENATDNYREEHAAFKALVMSKICRLVDDDKDIRIEVGRSLNSYKNEPALRGWVRAPSDVTSVPIRTADAKPTILYCDDKERWLSTFTDNHWQEYDITTVGVGAEFEPTLKRLLRMGRAPDIILIDLFHPRYDDPLLQMEKEIEGNAAIERLEQTVQAVRAPIYAAWRPYGLKMLEQARALCPETPIAIYTQQGLSVVEDEELVRVSHLGGQWLLKGRDRNYETMRLRDILLERG